MIHKRGNKGFTFVEIMIVVAIIALLAAIVIPNILRARLNSNESAAQSTLRLVSKACESYRVAQRIPSYDPAALGANMTGATLPYLDAGIFATGGREGYIFTYTPMAAVGSVTQQYVCGGEPVTLNITGSRTFAINETGVLRVQAGKATISTEELYNAMTVIQ